MIKVVSSSNDASFAVPKYLFYILKLTRPSRQNCFGNSRQNLGRRKQDVKKGGN